MAMNIGEAFLYHAEKRGFQIPRQPIKIVGHLEINSDAAASRKALYIPAESGSEASFIEQRRMKQIGNGADVRSHVLDQSFALGHGSSHFCKVLKIAAQCGQIHRERGQGLSHTVVQLARESAS